MKPLKIHTMTQDIFLHEPLSTNIYVKRSQLINRINKIRDIMQHQKFSKEILYRFQTLHDNLTFYKMVLNDLNVTINKLEQSTFIYGA